MNAAMLRARFEAGARQVYANDRGDGHLIHAADVKGCNIATRARILGKPMLEHNVAKLLQFRLGHAAEDFLSTSLEASLLADGWRVERDVHVYLQWSPDGDAFWGGDLDWCAYPRLRTLGGTPLLPDETIVGHIDLRAVKGDARIIVEAKSVDRAFPDQTRWSDQTQANFYAMCDGLRGNSTVVVMMDRRSGDYRFYDTDPLAQLHELRRLCLNALACYESDPPAETLPPEKYSCSFCDYGGCERNTNPERLSLEGVA